MDGQKGRKGFGPVIGCHRMGEKGEDDKKKTKDLCMFKRESGESRVNLPFLTACDKPK